MASSDCPEIQFLPQGRAATRLRPFSFGCTIERRPTMSHGNGKLTRLARPHAERAILRLAAIVDDGYQSASARVAAARALLEFGFGRLVPRPRATPAAEPMPRVIEVNWGDPTE
jgi:hypothetical protein